MYVGMCACMYVHIYVYMFLTAFPYTHPGIHIRTYTCIYNVCEHTYHINTGRKVDR